MNGHTMEELRPYHIGHNIHIQWLTLHKGAERKIIEKHHWCNGDSHTEKYLTGPSVMCYEDSDVQTFRTNADT